MAPSPDRQTFREVLAGLAAKTLTRIPALNGRVEKACKRVLGGDVELHPDGTAVVNSLTDPTRAYQVTGTPGLCQCKDYDHAPEHLCCHRLAVGFQRKVQELLPAPLPPAAPLGEAPASVNVRIPLHGREVQVTLRDTDELRLLARLEELLQRYAPQLPASAQPPPPAEATPQCPQHGALKRSTKGKGWYCPGKMADGSWCQYKDKGH